MSHWTPSPEQLERITGAVAYAEKRSAIDTIAANNADFMSGDGYRVAFGMPDSLYRAHGGVSQSFLKSMRPRPAHAKQTFAGKDTSPMRLGRYIHQGTLTPHDPLPDFAVYPETYGPENKKWTMNANECKTWVARHEATGKTVLTRKEYEEMSGCIRSLAENPSVRELMTEGNAEVSLFVRMEVESTPFIAKTRIDWRPKSSPYLWDYKKVADKMSSLHEVKRKVLWEGWGFQAAFELALHNICFPEAPRFNFGWKVIEGADPFVIQTYEADWDDLTRYRNETVEALKVFAESVREGRFAGDRDDTQRITE